MNDCFCDGILKWPLRIRKTQDFSVIEDLSATRLPDQKCVIVDICSQYTRDIIISAILRRPWCKMISPSEDSGGRGVYQFSEFELINWDPVLSGEQHASSYVVRKGLSRKAQLALQIKKYCAKHPESKLKGFTPHTVIVETWNAFEDMKFDFGMGAIASFSADIIGPSSLRQKLEWCLDSVREVMAEEAKENWLWILKPSVTNKGADIAVIRDWEGLLDKLESVPDIREWVLQE
jgi:tubulin--tyrosine ligase